jgi:hypothetical protein
MTKVVYKILWRDGAGRLYSFLARGVMIREYMPNYETKGWEGTPLLVAETLQDACNFVKVCCFYGNYEIWVGDGRDVVPLPSGSIRTPDFGCDLNAYRRFWSPAGLEATTIGWPPGTLAVSGFTPREMVWNAEREERDIMDARALEPPTSEPAPTELKDVYITAKSVKRYIAAALEFCENTRYPVPDSLRWAHQEAKHMVELIEARQHKSDPR